MGHGFRLVGLVLCTAGCATSGSQDRLDKIETRLRVLETVQADTASTQEEEIQSLIDYIIEHMQDCKVQAVEPI